MTVNHLLSAIGLFLFCLSTYAQSEFSPTVVVTYPYEVNATDSILEDLSDYNREIEITEDLRNQYVSANLAENWKIIRTKELDYLKSQTFFSQLPFLISSNLTYKIYEYHNNPVIYPISGKISTVRTDLQSIAKTESADWVINIVKMEAHHSKSSKTISARIVLYNIVTNRIFLDKTYTKQPVNPGGQLECEAGSWQCALNSVVDEAVADIFDQLEKNRRYWSTDG